MADLPLVRSTRGLRHYTCPFCGRRVLGDDRTCTIHHEAPTCAGFEAKMVELGLKPKKVEPTIFVDDVIPVRITTNQNG
jgi:hypothetical protein